MTSTHVARIAPSGSWPSLELGELWAYRNLLVFLVWRDLKVRYAQTVLGASWAVIQPLLTTGVFTIVFGRFARIPSEGVPYGVFSLAALVPWMYFSTALTAASQSLVSSSHLLTKVYFPRLVIPLAPVLAGLGNLVFTFALLLAILLANRIVPFPSAVPAVAAAIVAMMLVAFGVGCWLSAFNIQYRDVQQIVPFLMQIWMYLSPIVYPTTLVPQRFQAVYRLNPMVGVIEAFRGSLLRTHAVDWASLGLSLAVGAILCVSGMKYFRRMERIFADVA